MFLEILVFFPKYLAFFSKYLENVLNVTKNILVLKKLLFISSARVHTLLFQYWYALIQVANRSTGSPLTQSILYVKPTGSMVNGGLLIVELVGSGYEFNTE